MNLKKIKKILSRGMALCFGGFQFHFAIKRASLNDASCLSIAKLNLRQANYLLDKFPELKRFEFKINQDNAGDILDFYFKVIPLIHPAAHEVSIRNALNELMKLCGDPDVKDQVIIEIAKSDLINGLPDRAGVLAGGSLGHELQKQRQLFDIAYGAPLLEEFWGDASRGATLRMFFESHLELLKSKKILHFSPEAELRDWILKNVHKWGSTYETSNVIDEEVDLNLDLTALGVADLYDVIICHRVLEHIQDDMGAISEMYKALRPGGLLSISVPQSMHVEKTVEWRVPDSTHHDHVRQYGSDFVHRLTDAGFKVEVAVWALQQSITQYRTYNAFPMRMYLAYK